MAFSIDYITKNLQGFSELEESYRHSVRLSAGGIMICLNGDCTIVIDAKQYHINRWDMVVVFPYSVVQSVSSSDDFESVVIGAEAEFFAQIQIANKSGYFTAIKEHPSIALQEDEVTMLLALHAKLLEGQSLHEHPFRKEIDESVLKIILYEVAAIYSRRKPNSEEPRSRESIIFHNFIFALFNDFKRERSLGYYAQAERITPSHLSKAVSRASGISASRWISECVVNNMKVALRDKKRSIAQISEEFCFPNNSFFSQYFKKYSGMSPSQYRASID
ncbi:MAG: helix-turn-helix domain-containing protein [Rikenellaceae bacterium]